MGVHLLAATCRSFTLSSPSTAPLEDPQTRRPWWGVFSLLLGGYMGYQACTTANISTDQRWPMSFAAAIFLLTGLFLVLAGRRRVAALVSAAAVACMSVFALFVAFTGNEQLQSNISIPFLPAPWNLHSGRMIFASGALISAILAVFLFVRAFKVKQERGNPDSAR